MTVDSKASMPSSAVDLSGTPMTGRVVCAATTPARCADMPAHAMKTSTPACSAAAT